MTKLSEIVAFLDTLLESEGFPDSSLNGLQVEAPNRDISRVACAVDAGEKVIERAIAEGAQLLVVHHGLFWGQSERVTGPLARKLQKLFQAGCSLYASHLPLDAHPEVGNAFELGRFLGMTALEPFCLYQGRTIGARASLQSPLELQVLAERLSEISKPSMPLVIAAGKKKISTLGIVTGSGSFAIKQCAEAKLDLLLSGEPKHEVFHLAHELQISAIFAGHYATETFGVKALGKRLKSQFGIDNFFIDLPSGI